MPIKPVAFAIVASLGLAARGDTVGERDIIGGAVGAGAAAVNSSRVVTGAAVGAAGNIVACELDIGNC